MQADGIGSERAGVSLSIAAKGADCLAHPGNESNQT